ncbi:FAD-binding oxidoreductase [Paralcaligenes sp. KSB-10]|uniref:NAD(P)/FAD-dependent oxidoreductase n=1 Tax=Paralcaligenes sp. KSB-10 TaxID=2901142 RepID=UPI001E5FF4EA|nr:FAD-binding oxidoreductase [Paralcaligenes sp. KSB-10]UHL64395.1 FAD-binding oxidoreductase [Paralcaligenes sp. KSB-10]
MDAAKLINHPDSVWAATANRRPELPLLKGDVETEVAIIGGGYSGLSTAHHLSKSGVDCVVIEANDVGWGASGRNGGMAVLRYKNGYSTLVAQFGDEVAMRLYQLVLEAVDTLESIVREYGIDCDFARYGHITAANGRKNLAMLQADVDWLSRNRKDNAASMLDREQMREQVGTSVYPGGYLDPRSAGIHPLNYARGLAAGLSQKGIPIYVGNPVDSIRREPTGIILTTPAGRVHAKKLVIATNAYTDLMQLGVNLSRRIVPVSTSVLATAPLAPELASRILAGGRLVTDTRHLVNYFRMLPGNRLLYGGRGDITGKESPDIYRGLHKALIRTFPSLSETDIEFRWSGKVAVTLDDFPHFGSLEERIFYAIGYGGRGVALTNLFGKLLARMVQGEAIAAGPLNSARFEPIPFHRWRIPGMQAVAGYYWLLDKLEQ